LAFENVFMEHDYAVLTAIVHRTTPIESVVQQIRSLGPERCVLSSDAGQVMIPDLVTGLKDFIRQLTVHGISKNELDIMLKKNPQIVLGLL
jgi:predicted metal-dependent phosphotriesterase family hydrolase